ncbi:hypothetical protein FRB90_007303, partial [Tulasnella sp. 427]
VEAPEVVIVFNLRFVRYRVKIGGVDMTIVKVGSAIHHLQECFDWISNAVGQPLHHVPLTLELHGCPVKQHHLEWLTRHAIVTKLILSGVEWSDNLRRIFRSLGRPTTSMPVTSMEAYMHPPDPPHFATAPPQAVDPPIHRLPLELVVDLALWIVGPNTRTRDLMQLAQVCQRWRTLLCGTPALWASINAAEGTKAFSKAFQMAGDAPLDLEYRHMTGWEVREAFFELAGERVQQWRSLLLDLTLDSSGICFSPPILNYGPSPTSPAAVYLRKVGDSGLLNLKEISLIEIAIDIAALHLTGLQSLTLQGIPGVTPTAIFDALTASPSIQTIALHDLSSLTGWTLTSSDPPNSRLSLGRLRQLSLKRLHISVINLFLSLIEAPQLRTLVLHCNLQGQSPTQLQCDRWCRQILPSSSAAETVAVTVAFIWTALEYSVIIGRLDMTLFNAGCSDHDLQDCFDWISNAVGQPLHHVPLTLQLRGRHPQPRLLEWFTRYANVTNLNLYDTEWGDLKQIIPSLGLPTASMPTTFLVPGIEVLKTNLVWAHSNPELVEMLERRYSSPVAPGVTAPKPLRELRLSSIKGGLDPTRREFVSRVLLGNIAWMMQGADFYWEGEKWTEALRPPPPIDPYAIIW